MVVDVDGDVSKKGSSDILANTGCGPISRLPHAAGNHMRRPHRQSLPSPPFDSTGSIHQTTLEATRGIELHSFAYRLCCTVRRIGVTPTMGRKPNQLVLEFFHRGRKLEDASNRYEHTCKRCGDVVRMKLDTACETEC
jgi:hypothetical protein